MSNMPPREGAAPAMPTSRQDAVALVSAYGTFRVLLIGLAIWTFFAGFALITQSFDALTFGGEDHAAERVVGGHMLMLVPVYVLLAWRRDGYRLLIWIPYAAQIAIIIPILWDTLTDPGFDGALLFVMSLIFLILLVYVWLSSHPSSFFQPFEDEAEEYEEDDAAFTPDAAPAPSAQAPAPAGTTDDAASRGRRYRRTM